MNSSQLQASVNAIVQTLSPQCLSDGALQPNELSTIPAQLSQSEQRMLVSKLCHSPPHAPLSPCAARVEPTSQAPLPPATVPPAGHSLSHAPVSPCAAQVEPTSQAPLPPATVPLAGHSRQQTAPSVTASKRKCFKYAVVDGNSRPHTSNDYLIQMINIYECVRATQMPNYQKARIPLPRDLNVQAWRQLASGYEDQIVFDYLEYGHPSGYVHGLAPLPTYESPNHPSALKHPDVIQKHIDTEISQGAMLGPFPAPPYQPWCHISPLMTADKKDWSLDENDEPGKRTVTDLSWPRGLSVNDGCPKDLYDSYLYKLQLPSADNLIEMIKKNGQGCWLWSHDISRAFRQLPLDPLDWPLLCIKHEGNYYSDISLAFGARWASASCQRMSNSLTHIMAEEDHDSTCYIDDHVGCEETKSSCEQASDHFENTCDIIKLQRAVHKGVRSTQLLRWIGWLFDTIKMQVRLPEDKKRAILNLCKKWSTKSCATLKELRQLLGKLLHISQVVKPARLFLNRMLDTLRHFPDVGTTDLSDEFMKDVMWFVQFLDSYNGINMIQAVPTITQVISVDSCMTGCGGVFKDQCYHQEFPAEIVNSDLAICHLEMLNCLVSLRMWCDELKGETVVLNSDSQVAISVLQHGRSRDPFMLDCARHVWMVLALYHITLISEHVPGESLIMSADALSRYHISDEYRLRAERFISENNLTVLPVAPHMFKMEYSI